MFGRCLFVCFQSRWSQVRERNISEAVLSLKATFFAAVPQSALIFSRLLTQQPINQGDLTSLHS